LAAQTFSSITLAAGSEETIMNAADERWQYYWDLHVMSAVRLTRGLVPFMRQRGVV